eukprot:COSAG01_NODE_820_length_13331_cov_12.238171_5_plen_120_part_00
MVRRVFVWARAGGWGGGGSVHGSATEPGAGIDHSRLGDARDDEALPLESRIKGAKELFARTMDANLAVRHFNHGTPRDDLLSVINLWRLDHRPMAAARAQGWQDMIIFTKRAKMYAVFF